MSPLSRFLFRLRRRLLRCYEIGMCAVLVAVALTAGVPSAAAPESAAAQCGKIQSSAAVMVR